MNDLPGGCGEEIPPAPIPNTEVTLTWCSARHMPRHLFRAAVSPGLNAALLRFQPCFLQREKPARSLRHASAPRSPPNWLNLRTAHCGSQPRRLNLRIASLPLALLVSLASFASLYPPQAALSFGTRFASLLRLALSATGGASSSEPQRRWYSASHGPGE